MVLPVSSFLFASLTFFFFFSLLNYRKAKSYSLEAEEIGNYILNKRGNSRANIDEEEAFLVVRHNMNLKRCENSIALSGFFKSKAKKEFKTDRILKICVYRRCIEFIY